MKWTAVALGVLGAPSLHAEEATHAWTTPFTEQLVNQEVSVDVLTPTPKLALTWEADDRGGGDLWYGTVLHRVGLDLDRDARLTLFAVRYQGGRATRVWFDANRNGDLRDDAEPTLYGHPSSSEARAFLVDLAWTVRHQQTELPVTRRLRIVLDPLEDGIAPVARTQVVFGRAARIELGGQPHLAMLMDGNVDGLYTEDFADGVFVDLDDDRGLEIDMMSPEFGPFSVPFEMAGRRVRCRSLDPRGNVLEWTDLGPGPQRIAVGPGAVAPDFSFPDSSGRERRLSDCRGRWVLVDFWASWCSACVDQAPALRALYERWHPRGLEIVGVSFDEDAEAMASFRRREGHDWATRFTGRRYWEEPAGRLYQAGGAGLMFLVDPAGRIVGKYTDVDEVAEVLAAAIAAAAGVAPAADP